MQKTTAVAAAAAALLVLFVSCGDAGRAGAMPEQTAFYYSCGDNTGFTAKYEKKGDMVWIFGFEDARRLSHLKAASGSRYGDGIMTYWGKGSSATIEYKGRTYNCVEDRGRSLLEDSKLRGMDFRASGNEPGWVMEIGGEKIFLYTGYGKKKLVFRAGKPQNDMKKGTTVYNAAGLFGKMRVLIESRECFDDMSGYHSGISVEYELDGRVYRGCGRPLR